MIVMKFGGKSLRDSVATREAALIVREHAMGLGGVVVSAHGDTTDRLLDLARRERSRGLDAVERFHRRLLAELSLPRDVLTPEFERLEALLVRGPADSPSAGERLHAILAFGERASARILAAHLTESGLPARPVFTDEAGVITDEVLSAAAGAEPLDESVGCLRALLEGVSEIPVVTGFIGRDRAGRATTLGRHGSDETAVLVACALGAREVQIWTDVDGIMTHDPRSTGRARLLERLSFLQARRLLGEAGAPLHPRALRRAHAAGIPLHVRNSSRPSGSGTVIAG